MRTGVHAHLTFRKRFQYRAEYDALRTLLWVCARAPMRLLRRGGSALGWFAYHVLRLRRGVVTDNIRRSFPDWTGRDVERVAKATYLNAGRSFFELLAFSGLDRSDVLGMVTIEGRENFEKALDNGKGAILFSGHFGNWELLGAVIGHLGYPIHATDTNHSNKLVHAVLTKLRSRHGMTVLSPDEPVASLVELLRENKMITYLADQDARRDGVFVDFFGRPASTLRGPALLAMRTGCPVLPGFLIREGVDRHRAVFGELMWPDRSRGAGAGVHDLTQRFTRLLEDYVRRYPDNYFWMHRRWKTRP
jgi:KDO2-lipid IV(A) lauroyltransferase